MKQPELGKKILELRQNKGLTQNELADECNLSLRTVQRIESAEVMPRNYTIKLIFSKLDYDYEQSNNNQDRPIKGTKDWAKYEIILDVPEESGTLNFGILLSGTGKVWFDNISFEIVDKMENETSQRRGNHVNKKPTNLDFR